VLYLIDANVLIDANRDYYALNRVPEFWDWLLSKGEEEIVKIPVEVYEEVKDGKDLLGEWARTKSVKDLLVFKEDVDETLVAKVIDKGYAPDLKDDEVEKIGRDPFLLAYALIDKVKRCVVSTEVSKPKRERANRHLPDVCKDFNVKILNAFEFVRECNFTTYWKS
jgi:hypothetical protein